MIYNAKGTVIEITPTIEVGEKKYPKREIVISDNHDQYPQHVKFEFSGQHTEKLDHFEVGDMVDIAFNLRGRAWQNKEGNTIYFNTLSGFQINDAGVDTTKREKVPQEASKGSTGDDGGDGTGLPF